MRKTILIGLLCFICLDNLFGQIQTITEPLGSYDSVCAGSSVTLLFKIKNLNATPITLTGCCKMILSATQIGTGPSFTKTIPAGATTVDTMIVGTIPSAISTGLYPILVRFFTNCTASGGGILPSPPSQIYIGNPPAPVITASGSTTICDGNSVTLSTTETGVTYLWSPDGQTTSSVAADSTATYSLTTSNYCGTVTSNTISVIKKYLPTVSITALSDTVACSGTAVILDGTVSSNASSYVWNNGDPSTNITISTIGTNVYYMTASNMCGSDTSNSITVTIYPTPAAPTITASASGDTLYSSYPTGNIWDVNDTLNYYVPTAPGNYVVMYTDTNGCSATSAQYPFGLGTDIESIQSLNVLNVYPNPAIDYIFIENTKALVSIYNIQGQLVMSTKPTNNRIDISHLEKGIYFLRTEKNKETVALKFIIL